METRIILPQTQALGENALDHLAKDVRQAVSPPLEFVGQPLVVDA